MASSHSDNARSPHCLINDESIQRNKNEPRSTTPNNGSRQPHSIYRVRCIVGPLCCWRPRLVCGSSKTSSFTLGWKTCHSD
jgi:hypothetical protein